MENFVSVIIATYNRAASLRRALQSLAHQTLNPDEFEVIVVDDGSTDSTLEVCEDMSHELTNMKYITLGRNKGIGYSSNLGVRAAKGDLLIFTDDDCIVQEDWAECMRDALIKHPLVAGSVLSPTSNYIKLCHNIAEFHPFMQGRKAGPIDFIAGANMGFRRSVFEEVHGFRKDNSINSDMHFILQARELGYQIYFIPEAVVTHDHERKSLPAIFKYTAYHGSKTIILRNRFQELLKTPFILRSPVLIIAAAPIIALKVTAGIYFGNPSNLKYILTLPVVYALKLAWCWGAVKGLKNWNKSEKRDEQAN